MRMAVLPTPSLPAAPAAGNRSAAFAVAGVSPWPMVGRRVAHRIGGAPEPISGKTRMPAKLVATLVLAGLAAPALAQEPDPALVAAGEKVFKRCAACHMIGPDAKNRVGPSLEGIIGRPAGTAP